VSCIGKRLRREKTARVEKDLFDKLEEMEVASGITGENAALVNKGAANVDCVAVEGGDARCH
jgi:hypothetical protein